MQFYYSAESDQEVSHFIVSANEAIRKYLRGKLSIQQAAGDIRRSISNDMQDHPNLGGEFTMLRLHTEDLMRDVSADSDETKFLWSEVDVIIARIGSSYSS